MPVDLTPASQVRRLREATAALRAERDGLREQVKDLDTLYDELAVRDDKVARLEERGIEDMRATILTYRAALTKISESGRGAKRIAAEALEQAY